MRKKIWLQSWNEINYSEDLGVDGRIILKCFREAEWECVGWIHVAQDRDRLRALVNTVMKLRVP
jgi:hypothetical protein